MSFSGPTKYCPRCNTLLPAQAPFCGTCGLQFSAPSGPGAGSAPYGGQGAPGGWPQSQPGYPPPAQPGYGGYPPGQPGPAGYAPAAFAPPSKKGGSGKLIAIILIVVVVLGGAIGGFFYLRGHTTSPSSPLFDRHGLPGNVPLPDGVTFKLQQTVTSQQGEVDDEWFWTVDSPNDPATVQKFYQSNLPSNGWTHVQTLGSSSEHIVIGCQSNQIVGALIDTSVPVQDGQGKTTSTITAPSGGSALEIAMTSDTKAVLSTCG